MGYSDFVAKLRPDLFDAYGDDQQDPVKLPDIQNPSLPPVQIAPTQQNIPAPEIDPHQAAIESIFGKARPNFGIALPETNLKPATSDYQPPKVKARAGSVSSAKVPKQTGTIEGSVEAKNPYTGGSTNPALPNELGGNFKTYDDLMNWKPSSGFQSGAPLAQYVDLQSKLKGLPRPDRDFKTLDEFNQWYREAQQGQNAQNQPSQQQQQAGEAGQPVDPDGNKFKFDEYGMLHEAMPGDIEPGGLNHRWAKDEARPEDDDPLAFGTRTLKLSQATGRRMREASSQNNGRTMSILQDAFLNAQPAGTQEAARFAASLIGDQPLFSGNLPTSQVKYDEKRNSYNVDVSVPKWFDEAVQAYMKGGPDAARQAVMARKAREQAFIERQNAKKDASDAEQQAYMAALNPNDPSKVGAFARIAETEAEKGIRNLSGNIAGLAGAAAGTLGFDDADRYLTDIYKSRKELNRTAEEAQANQANQTGLGDVAAGTAKALGSLPQLAGEMALGPGGLIGSRMIAGADKPIGEMGLGVMTAPAEVLGMNAIAEAGARPFAQKLANDLVPKLMEQGLPEGLARTGAEVVGTLTNVTGRSAEGAGFNVAAALSQGETDPKKLREAAITGALLPNIMGLKHTRIETEGRMPNFRQPAGELGDGSQPITPERGKLPPGSPEQPQGNDPSQSIAIIQDAARTQPDHPVVRALLNAGIDPEALSNVEPKVQSEVTKRVEEIAQLSQEADKLQQQKGTADQQLQNVQDQLRMGRVPTDAEQQQAQQGQVVAQQIEQNIQQQQAVIDDLAQNVTPFFETLVKAISAKEKTAEPITDVADDATKSLVSEVRKAGGISAGEGTVEKGELDRLSPKESGTTGLIRRDGGQSADQMREQMASEGLTKAETAQDFIQEVEAGLKQPKKGESESFDEYQRSQMSDTERSDSDLLDTLSKDRAHPFTRVYRALDNTKTVYTPQLARDFVREADKAGFSGDFIESALGDFKSRRGLVTKEEAEVIPQPQVSNRTVSQYRQMTDANKPAIDRLHSLNLNSEEAKGLIAGIQQFNKREGISPHHLGNLLDGIKDWQVHHPPKGMEGRRTPKEPQVSATRNPESQNAQPARSEPTPKLSLREGGFTLDQRKTIGRDVTNLMDVEFDDHLKALEKLQNDAVHGKENNGIDLNGPEYKALVGSIIEARKERTQRVKAGRLPALNESRNVPGAFSKVESGKALVAGKKPTIYDQPVSELDDVTIAKRIRSNETIENTMKGDVEYGKSEVARKRREYVGKLKEEEFRRKTEIDQAAHEAATSPKNDLPEPTESQKEAGNYKKGHINIHGLDVTIENPQGSVRSGKDPDGKDWSVEMSAHYGYIRRTEGADGEQVDVYIGNNPESDRVFVIDQIDKESAKFDEHKVFLRVKTEEEAESLYDAHFSDGLGSERQGAITEMSIDQFKDWLKNGDNTKPLALRTKEQNKAELESKLRGEEQIMQSQVKAMDKMFGALDKPPIEKEWTRKDVEQAVRSGNQDDVPESVLTKYPDLYDEAIGEKPKENAVSSGNAESRVLETAEGGAGTLGDAPVSPRELTTKEAKGDERLTDSTGPDGDKSGDDGRSGAITSPDDAGNGKQPAKAGAKSGPGVSRTGSTGRKPKSEKPAPLFDNAPSANSESVIEQGHKEIESVEAKTEPLAASEAVIQAATADLPAEPEPEAAPEPEPQPKPVRTKPQPLSVLTGASFAITPEVISKIRSGGAVTKYKQNVDAIKTMRQVLQEGRKPTTEEMETMALYAGFGGIKTLFYPYDYSQKLDNRERAQWVERQRELKELIGEEAFTAASKSTMNAHFTDPHIVSAMWTMAKQMGLEKGRFLEPSMGSGNFVGLVPADLRDKMTFTGVELDPTTGNIAKLLYPDANIHIQGFEDLKAPDNFFDIAMGNVPFGDYRISDNRYNKLAPQIHNYFFLKAMDKVRPGGLVMFITSTGTMDSRRAQDVRKELYKQADLVSAIRFPAETFGKTALTSVVTDLVILRKRLPGEEPKSDQWIKSSEIEDPRGPEYPKVRVNDWLAANPKQMLGEFNGNNKMYPGRANVDRTDDFEQRLAEAIASLPTNVMTDYAKAVQTTNRIAGAKSKEGGYTVQDGKLMQNHNGGLAEVDAKPERVRRVESLLKIRDAFDNLIDGEMGRTALGTSRKDLNSAYDSFVAKYGPINEKKNREALEGDPDLPRLMALEDWDSKRKVAKKQPIFTKSTVVGSLTNEKPKNVQEALVKSFQTRGEIVLPEMAAELGLDEHTVGDELVARKIAFQTPQGNWELAAHYLSGNVRRKLSEARVAAATDSFFQANVDALEAVTPKDVQHTQISVEMGAPWMEPEIISQFVASLFNDDPALTKVHYDRNLGMFNVGLSSRISQSSQATTLWGTPRAPFGDLLNLALTGRSAKIMDKVEVGDSTTTVFNPQATQAANTKLDAIKKRFKDWVWQDEDRRTRLTDKYNDLFNSLRPAEYDVKFMLDETGGGQVPGMNPNWKMRPHQMAAIFRAVIEKRGLLAHEVGLGKTLAMIGSAAELKRLGIARKPAIAVPKKVIPAFANTVRAAFPLLKLHVVDSRDAEKRQTSMSQVATGDHDLILMTHDNMDMLKMKPEFEAEMLQNELDEVNAVYNALRLENRNANKQSPEGRILKQIENRREKLAAKIKDALNAERKDNAISFEDTGIDFLFVDEFHKYKSLPVVTALGQVKGVPTGDSQRAMNMLMRARYLQRLQKGGGLIAATGTPISNSLVEAWIMAKFLQPDLLEESGVQSFDAWVRQFAETVPALEMDATGKWKTVSRLSKFRNLPELQVMSRMTLDVKTAKETGILDVRPKRIDKVIQVPQTAAQAAYMQVLRERAEAVKNRDVEPYEDNFLVISSDGMLMASDPRLVLPGYNEEGGKIQALTDNVLRILKEKPGNAQMIFSDSGVSPNAWGFHLYEEIIKKLEAGGIPRDKIINFSKLDTDKKVEAAVARLNSGDALIAIGHRENMGTGVNAQEKMAAIHQFDVPWKPALVEQSEARGWRQGNTNKEIEILSYVTEGSFDAVKWSTVARKQQSISAFMQKPGLDRELEDSDDDSLSYDQIAAAASGDGDYLRKAELDAKVFKLSMMQQSHDSEALSRRQEIPRIQDRIAAMERRAVTVDRVSEAATAIKEKEFSYRNTKGELIEDKKDAAKDISSAYLFAKDRKEKTKLGTYKGLSLYDDGYGFSSIELPVKGGVETFGFNVNTTEFSGTLQSIERKIAAIASDADAKYIREITIPNLKEDLATLQAVTDTPFAYTEQLNRARKQLEAVNKRLRTKEQASAAEGEPLQANGTDVRAVSALGRQVRRDLREKNLKTPAEVQAVLERELPRIEAAAKDQMEVWKEFKRRKAEEFLEEMGGDTGLAGMAVTAKSVQREQALYDPELDSTPPASLGPPKATELANPLDALLYQSSITKSRGSRGVRMYVNDHARAILGAALTQVFQRDYKNINAINLSRDEVYRVASYMDKVAGQLPGENYKKGAEAFAQSLRAMVDDSKGQRTFNIVDITPFAERHEGEIRSDVDKAVEQFKGTIREESFHWSQRQVDGQSIALVGASWAQSSKGYAKYRKALIEKGYPDDPETIAAEAAAKIAAGLYDELGIRSEADHQQAAAWLASYFERVAEKHGLDALDKFDRLLQPAKAAKEKGAQSVRERLAERIRQEQERATAGSNRPRAPGGGGETVQANEASKSERRQEPVRRADIDAPFEGGKIKGPQLPLSEQVNSQNVRLAGEKAPDVGGAGFGGKPPKGRPPLPFGDEPAEPPKPWEREPKQRRFGEEEPTFDKAGNPTRSWKKLWDNFSDVINIPKAWKATYDLSATLRQGFYLAVPHPIKGAKSFVRQVKSLKQSEYDKFYKWLKNHPAYKDAKAAGLEFSGDDPLNINEENFGTRLAGKIPGVAMAERAFVTMLDSMRIEVFDLYRKTANKQFKDPRERFESHEAAASWINKTSGRADFGKGKYGNFMRNAAIPFLNVFGWSPRFVYSRFQMLNPWTYAQNLKNAQRRVVFVRQVAEIFQTAATLVATGALATAAGGNISLDEDNPDFLKIRFGTTRYDVLAGVQQAARLAIKIGKWVYSRGAEDDEKKLKKVSRETVDALLRFPRTKLAPVPGFFVDWLNDWQKVTGEVHRPGEFWGIAKDGDYSGAAAEFVNDPVISLALPMMFSNVVEAWVKGYKGGTLYGEESDHLKALMKVGAIEPFEFLGLGVQDYDRPEWKKQTQEKLEELDYDPKFPKRFQGEKEKDYQARVRRVIAEKEGAINRFSSDPNMKSQPPERAKQLLREEMSSDGMARLKKLDPEDIADDRMVRAWILTGVERLKKNPVFLQMSEDDQKKALESYHGRMNKYRAQPENERHGYIPPDVVDEDLLKEKIDAAIRSRRPNQ